MLSQLTRYYHTLKYLKWIQIKYQLWYRLMPAPSYDELSKIAIKKNVAEQLSFTDSIASPTSWLGQDKFQFLNITHQFENGIDWNYAAHGKLWTYNLNYFEFLSQPNLSKYEGLGLIHDFIGKEKNSKDGMEPFPISLRIIFWIKFLLKHKIKDESINQSMYRQLNRLSRMPEFHLMGNHLLENGFSLLFGAIYFGDEKILTQAKKIITEQLQEQLLFDGAHFELSPMYHQIMLFRVLDCLNLLKSNPESQNSQLSYFLKEKASLMLGWMKEMTFSNGHLARLNDSANQIAPASNELIWYAHQLGVEPTEINLSESGYRKFSTYAYEAIVDVGKIGPSYIPGHAHSDTFNFLLHHRGKPFIVDTGISTYEKNKRRNIERSTASHNTVMIDGEEQSEMWGGFRVGRRANITLLEEKENLIRAVHDGYQRISCKHQRDFIFQNRTLRIEDSIIGNKEGTAFLHFHPDINFEVNKDRIEGKDWVIHLKGFKAITISDYLYAEGFNKTTTAQKVNITFHNKLHTNIEFL